MKSDLDPSDSTGPLIPLNSKLELASHVACISLLLGLLGDGLLRVGPWGLNAVLWMFAFLAGTVGLITFHRLRLDYRAARWMPALILGAAALAWRDSVPLKLLTLVSLATLMALATWQARGVPLAIGAFSDQLARLGMMGLRIAFGFLPVLTADWGWPANTTGPWPKRITSVGVGLLIGFPLVLIFGGLFASADRVFGSMIRSFFPFDLLEAVSHLMLTLICAWIVGGYLIGVICREGKAERIPGLPQVIALGPLEVGVALGLLNLLFLAFIAVQVRYLFGGAALVEVTPGLTYAEYARDGFFQLVAAVALAWLVLWTVDWLLGTAAKRAFRIQALLMIGMLGVILASAFHRMRLYQAEYGWTELRFYVTAFMIWLIAALIWFVATVLRGERDRFLFGAAVAALIGAGVLHVLNPDAWIARRNLARMRQGESFDAAYAARLSADAAPVLAAALPELRAEDRRIIEPRLKRWAAADTSDWRLWSWSRARARAVAPAENAEQRAAVLERRSTDRIDNH